MKWGINSGALDMCCTEREIVGNIGQNAKNGYDVHVDNYNTVTRKRGHFMCTWGVSWTWSSLETQAGVVLR